MGVPLTTLNYEMLARKSSSPDRQTTDGKIEGLWAARDGSLVGMDWYTALSLEGRCYCVDTATGSTPDTFNDTYAAAEPDLYLYIPSGTTVIPVYLEVGFEDTGSAQVMDVFALASDTEDADRTVSGTVETITNMRIDQPHSSACSAWSVVTGITDPMAGNYFEFWRPYMGFAEDAYAGSTSWGVPIFHGARWSAKKATTPPFAVGPGCVAVWASAQAGTGFITLIWAELPSNSIV